MKFTVRFFAMLGGKYMLTTKNKTTRKVGTILTLFIALFMVVSSVLTVNAETLENNSNVSIAYSLLP